MSASDESDSEVFVDALEFIAESDSDEERASQSSSPEEDFSNAVEPNLSHFENEASPSHVSSPGPNFRVFQTDESASSIDNTVLPTDSVSSVGYNERISSPATHATTTHTPPTHTPAPSGGGWSSTPGSSNAYAADSSRMDVTPYHVGASEELDPMMYVKNLDTGERFNIYEVEKKIPQGCDPLSLHILALHEKTGVGRKSRSRDRRSKRPHFRDLFPRRKKEVEVDGPGTRVKVGYHKKREREWAGLSLIQELNEHSGAVWTMKFNHDGTFLATAGQDSLVRLWPVNSWNGKDRADNPVFDPRPYRVYHGHKGDVLDVAWSKTNFVLSSSMDRTVRLWHTSREDCLCYFQHVDFVTAVDFHPMDDRLFLSGSLDEKLRVWNIPERRVVDYVETRGLVTAACYSPKGDMAIAGLYNGKCPFFQMGRDGLKYVTTLDVRSTRGRNSRGKKVTGLQFSPSGDQILITTNDSRIRLYNTSDYSLACKYRGLENQEAQIKASFSPRGEYIVCGSEDHKVFIWDTHNKYVPAVNPRFTTYRTDRNDSYECWTAYKTTCTVAVFALPKCLSPSTQETQTEAAEGQVLVSAGYSGAIKVYQNFPNRAVE